MRLTQRVCLGALAALVVLTGWSASAMAQRVGYRLKNMVPLGQKPALVLQPGESIAQVELLLKRGDGQTQRFVRKNLKADVEVEIPFKQPVGTFKYTATLKMRTDAGASEVSFEFDATVAKRVSVKVLKELSSLAERQITVEFDGPVTHAEMVVKGDAGVIDERRIDLSGAGAGKPVPLPWQSDAEVAVRRIEIKIYDPAGFWTGLELIPFSVSIPHDEVNFDSGKSTFPASEAAKLDKTLALIRAEIAKYGDDLQINLYISGYTDTVGNRQSNLSLSYARARAIAAYFRQKGLAIPIYYQGFGEDALAVQTADEVDEPRNRRALYILGNVSPPKSGPIPRSDWRRLQ